MTAGPVDLTGRVALVTGASRGIGRAIAQSLAAHGARVVLHYVRDAAAAAEVLASLEGGGHVSLAADLTDPENAAGLAAAAARAHGRLDILVNNAGIYTLHPLMQTDYAAWREVWRRMLNLHLLGPANLIHQAVPHLIAAGGGHIVNITSRGAFRGEPEAPAYGASKAGLNALSQSLAQSLAPHNIIVTAVAPGFVETDMTVDLLAGEAGELIRRQSPLGRVAHPEEVAEVVLLLVSGRADYLTGGIVDLNGASYLRS